MARQDYGNTLLTKVLKPGSKFTITKTGFDTGRRGWICDSTTSTVQAPVIGSPDSVHGSMFVSNVDITSGKNGVDEIVADYLGLIRGSSKADSYTLGTKNEMLGGAPELTGTQWADQTALTSANFIRPLPNVTHVYIQKSEPITTLIGAVRKPPKYHDVDLDNYFATRFRSGYTRIFADWVLTVRDVREAGSVGAGLFYEVTDSYQYTVLEVKLSA